MLFLRDLLALFALALASQPVDDHREQAFVDLRAKSSLMGEAGVDWQAIGAPPPELEALLASPAAFAEQSFLITGRIAQMTALAPPFENVLELFVRDQRGRPIVLYVSADHNGIALVDGDEIQSLALFYKPVRFVARDGKHRSYPAFVNVAWRAAPMRSPSTSASSPAPSLQRLWLIAVILAVMAAALFVIMAWLRRQAAPVRKPRMPISVEHDALNELEESQTLPDDPAEALSELRRRRE